MSTAERLRDLHQSAYQDYQDLNHDNVIATNDCSALGFLRLVRLNRPAIIKNAIDHWPALTRWTAEYLNRAMGDAIVTVAETPSGFADAVKDGIFLQPHESRLPLSSMLDWLATSQSGPSGTHRPLSSVKYIQSQCNNLASEFSKLTADIQQDLPWATEALGQTPDAANLWIGNSKSITSLHHDYYENLYCQIRGIKRFHLFPPIAYPFLEERQFPQGRYVKHDDDHFTISIDESADKVWWITTDPLCIPSSSPCQPIVVDLHPGETLYLPSLWYHQVSSIDDVTDGTVISVNFWYDLAYEAPQYALFNHFRQSVLLVGDEGMVRRDRH